MPAPVRVEVDAGVPAQPQYQVVDRGVGQRPPQRVAPQVDEHVVAVQIAVLAVQVVGIQPDHLRPDRDRAGRGRLGPCSVVVDPWRDGQFAFGGGDVLVPQAQRLTDADAALPQQDEQEPVPQPGARIQDRLDLGRGENRRVLAWRLQLDRASPLWLPTGEMMQERLPPRTPQPYRPQTADSFRLTVTAPQWCSAEGSNARPPPRPAGGSRSHATNSPRSSSRTSRQSRPRRARKTNQSFRSWAYALTVFSDLSISVR